MTLVQHVVAARGQLHDAAHLVHLVQDLNYLIALRAPIKLIHPDTQRN